MQGWFTSKRWEPSSHICVSRWGWAWCTSSSQGAFAQLAGAAPTDSLPPVTRDLCPHVLGISTVVLMARGFVLSWKCRAKLRSHILTGRQRWNLAKARNSNSYETDLIIKKFVFLGFLVCRLWWFTLKALFLPYWCYVFPLSKDWDSSTTSDFRA